MSLGFRALAVAAVGVTVCAAALACETPVYRYATYNWTPTPYRIYHVSKGAKLKDDDPVRRAVSELTNRPTDKTAALANLELFELDTAAKKPLATLPPELREEASVVLERAAGASLPRFAVVLPHGYPVYEGPLSAADIRGWVSSPMRTKLIESHAAGEAAVMLLLEGSDTKANDAAAALILATAKRAATGELTPVKPGEETPADSADRNADGDTKPAAAKPGVTIGLLRLKRDDPQEKTLVDSLLHLEPDIAERTEPMVFTIYGRGRVAPPAIGSGIDQEQLDNQVRFVLGACACTIKHENPGMDLPLLANWDDIATAMAKQFGSETGNERLLGEQTLPGLFPEIVDIPDAGAKSENVQATAARSTAADGSNSASTTSANAPPAPTTSQGDATHAPVAATREGSDSSASQDAGSSLVNTVGLGVAAAVAVLAIASMFLWRRPA